MRYFCTYFDHRYLPKGLALYHSLEEHCPSFHLWILCLSPEAYEILSGDRLEYVTLLRLEDVENGDEALLEAKKNRSLVEYYFTLSPSLPLYVLNHFPEVDVITYLDSDLYFFADPEFIYDELGTHSVGIIGHRFPPRLKHMEVYGLYNVGWLSFRRDNNGLACLHWYRDRCNEWCYDRLEGDKFADQKYLDKFEQLFEKVHIINHKGANLAPWNIDNYKISWNNGQVYVDEQPLLFFHFQGFKRVASSLYDSGFTGYKSKLLKIIRDDIFSPYVETLRKYGAFAKYNKSSMLRWGGTRYKFLRNSLPLLFHFLKKAKWIAQIVFAKSFIFVTNRD
jgi:hypothetical protein